MGGSACAKGEGCGCAPAPADDPALDGCSGGEAFVLQVLGDSMEPEFREGEIIVIEPEGLARDGSYVLAWHRDEWIFRQLRGGDDQWRLHALNPAYPDAPIESLDAVRGVVIQKAVPGRRRATRRYV
jgi:phage repressor protein C with HTH and peptisase S24 domain